MWKISYLFLFIFFKLVNRIVLLSSPIVGDLYGFQCMYHRTFNKIIKVPQLSAAFNSSFLSKQTLGRIYYTLQRNLKCLELFSVFLIGQERTWSLCWAGTKHQVVTTGQNENYLLLKSVWGVLRAYFMEVYYDSNLHIFSYLILVTTLWVSLSPF